ncbi:MAG TPA: hypothetical protein VMK31_09580 [Sphingomicrobium sp.]|nr:hypothetical protein [Sphingomicrobium sp.]
MREFAVLLTILGASAAYGQQMPASAIPGAVAQPLPNQPLLDLGNGRFSLPVIEYRAPGGTLKRGQGFIFAHDVDPNTIVGIGLFKSKPKEPEAPGIPTTGKSRKMAVGVSFRF